MRAAHRAAIVAGCAMLVGCRDDVPGRESTIVNTMVRADLPLLRTRPHLVSGKYAAMASNRYSFFRGTFALYLRDAGDTSMPIAASAFGGDDVLPLSIGDAHPENFGILRASDGTLAIEPNDFDGADRYPYTWELRRLCTGMVVAGRLSNPDEPAQQGEVVGAEWSIARAVASGYASAILAYAGGEPLLRQTEAGDSAIAEDLFERAEGDFEDREELDELTDLSPEGVRTLKRGGIDPDQPSNVYVEVPAFALAALPEVLARYRDSLLAPPPAEFFAVLDAARELGSGVASWPRIRMAVLVRGPTDDPTDDVILELKEVGDSGAGGWIPPGVSFDSVEDRLIGASRSIWYRPDAEPLWGATSMFGFTVQIKHESEGLKTIRTNRFVGALGTADEVARLGALLGGLLARMHAMSGPEITAAIAGAITDAEAFADEHASAGVAYANQVDADWIHFQNALARLGPTLGVAPEPEDAPSADVGALYGQPPPVAE